MHITRRAFLAAVPVAACSLAVRADEAKPDAPKVPLELKLTAKKDTYTLDLGGKTPAEFRKLLDTDGRPPATPAVELELEVKNVGDKEVKVLFGGDPVQVVLDLKGRGAETRKPQLAFTREFRIPMEVALAAGKSKTIAITNLTSGFRNASIFSYWTEPGEYTLTATYVTGVSPKPKDAKDAFDGFGQVKLTSNTIKIKVEEKK